MGSMDRGGIPLSKVFPAGTESPEISTAGYAWCSLHLPANFAAGTVQFQVRNETDQTWHNVRDADAAELAAVNVPAGGAVLTVPQEVNHARIWRFVAGAAQPELTFAVVNKV